MSVNNVQAVSDALKYINGVEIEEKKTSLTEDVKNSIFNPISVGFGALQVATGVKDISGANTIKEAIKTIASDGFTTEKATLENSIKFFQNQGTQKPVTAIVEYGAKKSFFETAKSAISSFFSKIPGSTLVKSGYDKFAQTGLGKVMKGTGAMAVVAIEGFVGLLTDVIPAFIEGGAESGFKQLGKTTAKAAGSGLGWAGGSVAGKTIGGMIGTVIGGPAGTAVGSLIGGFVGSIAGSVIGGGVAKKITGKSETEILAEQKLQQQASEIQNNNEAMEELNLLVASKVQEEALTGEVSKDTQIMQKYLQQGAFSVDLPSDDISYTGYSNNDNAKYLDSLTTSSQDSKEETVSNANYFAQAAEKIAKGDTSIYNISNEKLNSVFHGGNSFSSSNSSSSDVSSIFNNKRREVVNYYG